MRQLNGEMMNEYNKDIVMKKYLEKIKQCADYSAMETGDHSNMERAEKIVNQYKEYGMRQWYKINR
jgi:hypothetical protein